MQSTVVKFQMICAVAYCIITQHSSESDDNEDTRVIATDKGLVRGHRASDGDYLAYLGIPYAAPPIGENRYKAPLSSDPWNGVFEANYTVECPQMGKGDEDCLILNVFTSIGKRNGLFPVLVYIPGGAFINGRGPVNGIGPLVEKNIVVVTINYRIGALGFLCLGTEEAPGNAGLKDQVAALQWVKINIENFGGHPKQVTIYGTSAGSVSVELLMLSKLSDGLFERAILDSGSAFDPWAIDADPIGTAMDVAKLTNFSGDNMNSLIDFYRNIPAHILSRTDFYDYFQGYSDKLTNGNVGFAPCLENINLVNVKPFISDFPSDIFKKQKYKNVELMSMFAGEEGLFLKSNEFYSLNYSNRMESNFEIFLPSNLVFHTMETKIKVGQYVKEFYFGSKPVNEDTILEYLDYIGESLIVHGELISAKLHSHKSKVYLMEFSYRGNISLERSEDFKYILKAGHGDIKHYAFIPTETIISQQDQVIVDRISTLIANFVKFGDPTPEQNSLLPIVWPAVRSSKMNYLLLDNDMRILEHPHSERMRFWDDIYRKYGRDEYED